MERRSGTPILNVHVVYAIVGQAHNELDTFDRIDFEIIKSKSDALPAVA